MEELSYYNTIIEEYPLLSREEEIYLAKCISEGRRNKQKAREKLFNSNLRLVINQASRKKRQKNNAFIPIQDLISAGFNGLMVAIDKFDPESYNTRFSTCAHPWIMLYINKSIVDFNSNIKIPSTLLYQRKKFNEKRMEEDITEEEVMDALGLSREDVIKIEGANISMLSLQSVAFKEDGASNTIEDIIEDKAQTSAVDIACDNEEIAMLKMYIEGMDSIKKDIVESRYLGVEIETLDSIGERHSLSKERIRQLEKSALDDLRRSIKKKTKLAWLYK